MDPGDRQRLHETLMAVHDEVMPLGDALEWAALRCLDLELNARVGTAVSLKYFTGRF